MVGHKTDEKHGYNAVQIGFRTAKEKHVNKPQLEMFKQIGVEPKREIREFRITADAFPPIGAEITAQHFVPGKRSCSCLLCCCLLFFLKTSWFVQVSL